MKKKAEYKAEDTSKARLQASRAGVRRFQESPSQTPTEPSDASFFLAK
ncbi:MAG: hypothetical protein O3B43_06350 [Chloroflexi bacterium]|nr:hypothetical protein [Chloroflexota bacterium]